MKHNGFYLAILGRSLLFSVLIFAGACAGSPLAPGPRTQAEVRDAYLELARNFLVRDDTFEVDRLASVLTVSALYFSPELSKAAFERWAADPAFTAVAGNWPEVPKGAAGPPVTILMGLYSPDLRPDDVLKSGRYRPGLNQAGRGRPVQPVTLTFLGRANKFVLDYFPVFNHWEGVYLVQFPALPEGRDYFQEMEFFLDWPGGRQSLRLNTRP